MSFSPLFEAFKHKERKSIKRRRYLNMMAAFVFNDYYRIIYTKKE
jgi:hypothetical protein